MYKTGLFVGKFLPPHIGHRWAILDASKQCEKLVVLVGFEPNVTKACCAEMGVPFISLDQKVEWFKEEFKDYPNILIKSVDETKVPVAMKAQESVKCIYSSWEAWSKLAKEAIGEPVDAIFGSEEDYRVDYAIYFPECDYIIQDAERKNVHISSTMIRKDLKKYIDFILPSARKFFE